MTDKIITKPIYDKNGKYLGEVVGRPEHVERFANKDLAEQIAYDVEQDEKRNSK